MVAKWLRLLPFLPLGLALVGAPALLFRADGYPRMRALTDDLERTREENAKLERDVRHLRAEVVSLRDNPTAVERIARDELGFVRQDEIVFQFGRMQ